MQRYDKWPGKCNESIKASKLLEKVNSRRYNRSKLNKVNNHYSKLACNVSDIYFVWLLKCLSGYENRMCT